MFCSNCGNKLEDNANFCPKCGAKVESASGFTATSPSNTGNTFTDPRDGRVYRTVKIGSQVWMAENLAFAAEGSKCYGNDLANCAKYGRLYDWKTAIKACPVGWHLPSNDEWQILVDFVGGEEIAGKKLKARNGWVGDGNGTDYFGFSALPGGFGNSIGNFSDVGRNGGWWSATEDYALGAWHRGMYYGRENVSKYDIGKASLYSVRCVQD